MERIVVGVDGSQGSREALALAVKEAIASGGRVEAVHAWHLPAMAMYPYGAIALEGLDAYEQRAREVLDEVIGSTDTRGLAEPIETLVVEGTPAAVLLQVAKGADLLVVGSRGHGGFTGLLLGSVSTHVVHHAPCPVLVARPRRD